MLIVYLLDATTKSAFYSLNASIKPEKQIKMGVGFQFGFLPLTQSSDRSRNIKKPSGKTAICLKNQGGPEK